MELFKAEIAAIVEKNTGLNAQAVLASLETPSDPRWGDVALPCFRLSKELKKPPQAIAEELKQKIESSGEGLIEKITAGAYLNFYLNKAECSRLVLEKIRAAGQDFGRQSLGAGKTVVIDYSSPNIAKPFNVALLYGTLIGNSLYRLHKCLGYNTVGINYLGDWGTQFGKMMEAYKLWSCEEAVERDGVMELVRVYVKYHSEVEENPELDSRARAWLVKMQNGDEEALSLWQWFKEITLDDINKIYSRLGVSFDSYKGESFYNDKMGAVVDELREKGLLEESDGAMLVRLDEYKMPPCLILRGDGGTLYPTRDLASVFYRKKTYGFHKCLYVTGAPQALHFAQWFKVVGLMGYEWERDLVHVPTGNLSLEDGQMSTRKGNFILAADVLDTAKAKVLEIINEKNPELNDKEAVAEQVALGAVAFGNLYNSRVKDVVFVWDKMLNFKGETGPYVQYQHTRTRSVLRKAAESGYAEGLAEGLDYGLLSEDAAFDIIKLLSEFEDKIAEAADRLEPYVLARHVMALAQAFDHFYNNCPILTAEGKTREARLELVRAVGTALRNGLYLLGVSAPERM